MQFLGSFTESLGYILITIERRDPYTGDINKLTLDITELQLSCWESGSLSAKEAFPNLTHYEREFIMSGITEESWKKYIEGTDENSN